MAEFEVTWSPLSRKWQVWQRLADRSGCTIETLMAEFSSEGRARHETALLTGETPAGTEYQAPTRPRTFFLPRLGKRRAAEMAVASDVVQTGDELPDKRGRSSKRLNAAATEPITTQAGGTTDASGSPGWHREVAATLDRAIAHAAQKNSEGVRRLLIEALNICPADDSQDRAA